MAVATALDSVRRVMSVISARARWSQLAGKTFDGNRDLYGALGYKLPGKLGPDDYWQRYERNAIAARVVETPPKATWRGGGQIIEVEDPTVTTEFEAAWEALNLRLTMWSKFLKADIVAGLGEYSLLFLGAPGDYAAPLTKLRDPADLRFVSIISQQHGVIKRYVEDKNDPRYGLPLFYGVSGLNPNLPSSEREVHYTRIVPVVEGALDDPMKGQPRLQRVWNLLDDLEKVTGGGAEAFWLRAHQGMQFDLDKELEIDKEEEDALKEEVDAFVHNMKRVVRTRGVNLKVLGSEVANFDRNSDAIILQISAGTGIPHRILTGSERGELASTQDRNNWNERVADRRNEFAGPQVVRPFVDRLIEIGALPAPPQGYEVNWTQLMNLDEAEQAKVALDWATLNEKAGERVVGADEIRTKVLRLPTRADAKIDPNLPLPPKAPTAPKVEV